MRWIWTAVLLTTAAMPASAQQAVLDRTLGPDAFGEVVVWVPMAIENGLFAKRIAMAAQVPLVFEGTGLPLMASGTPQRVALTGKTVREALDLLVATDARYT